MNRVLEHADVEWSAFDKFEPIIDKYMPDRGEGDSLASQMVTAVNKLIYKWYNDGDVFDNNYALSGWVNDLSSFANWLYKYVKETRPILNRIYKIKNEAGYEYILLALAMTVLTEDFLSKYSDKVKMGSIYDCDGPFSWVDLSEYDDEEDWYVEEDDYYDESLTESLNNGEACFKKQDGVPGYLVNDEGTVKFLRNYTEKQVKDLGFKIKTDLKEDYDDFDYYKEQLDELDLDDTDYDYYLEALYEVADEDPFARYRSFADVLKDAISTAKQDTEDEEDEEDIEEDLDQYSDDEDEEFEYPDPSEVRFFGIYFVDKDGNELYGADESGYGYESCYSTEEEAINVAKNIIKDPEIQKDPEIAGCRVVIIPRLGYDPDDGPDSQNIWSSMVPGFDPYEVIWESKIDKKGPLKEGFYEGGFPNFESFMDVVYEGETYGDYEVEFPHFSKTIDLIDNIWKEKYPDKDTWDQIPFTTEEKDKIFKAAQEEAETWDNIDLYNSHARYNHASIKQIKAAIRDAFNVTNKYLHENLKDKI